MKLAIFMAALALCACAPARSGQFTPDQRAVMAIDAQLTGTWRLSSYTPDQPLSLAMLLGMQTDRIAVTFRNGRITSATPDMQFDRRYRLTPPAGDVFEIFIADEQGIEVGSSARFAQPNRIWFHTDSEPWRGQGTLERVP